MTHLIKADMVKEGAAVIDVGEFRISVQRLAAHDHDPLALLVSRSYSQF